MLLTVRGKILKTVGWSFIGVGFYMIALGSRIDGDDIIQPMKPDSDIIDADFTIIED